MKKQPYNLSIKKILYLNIITLTFHILHYIIYQIIIWIHIVMYIE